MLGFQRWQRVTIIDTAHRKHGRSGFVVRKMADGRALVRLDRLKRAVMVTPKQCHPAHMFIRPPVREQ